MVEVRAVAGEPELLQILALQRANLARSLDPAELAAEGFVTVEHTLEILQRMHALAPSIAAWDGADLAGYALVMPVECSAFLPVLGPMFARLAALGQRRYYVMGQICIGKPWRGRGLFDALYQEHRRRMSGAYHCVITEVATRNTRSLRAHLRVGFREIERYRDATDEWSIVRWDWS